MTGRAPPPDPHATSDVFTPEKRSQVMARVRQRNTAPELTLRRMLHAAGYRYRLHAKALPGSPDLAFASRKVALFVHGCFWHGHDCPRGARAPKANAAYWSAKIERNRARDAAAETALAGQGWRAVTVWECELRDPALPGRLAEALGPPGAQATAASAASGSRPAQAASTAR
ncbi:MAG TPA: very short patch repair endonuclease [Caulobacteraceae bacterium]